MTANELREELEEELRWRQEELAFFKNQLSNINSEEDSCRYRKSLVFLLYSHFEGYVKIALQTYIKYLNSLSLHQRDVIPALAAAGMHKEFLAYENLDRKCSVFRTHLPDDTSLHRFYRRVDFIDVLTLLNRWMNFKTRYYILKILLSIQSPICGTSFCKKISISSDYPSQCLKNIRRILMHS